jgi:group I intron endonuclease
MNFNIYYTLLNMDENHGIIYRITNQVNGKCYIGQTKKYYGEKNGGLKRRWKNHVSTAHNPNKQGCPYFGNAIIKHGANNFKPEVLLYCNIEDRDIYEIKMIDAYQSNNPKFGYNISIGGSGVHSQRHVTEEFRDRISQSQNLTTNLTGITVIENKDGSIRGYKVQRNINGIRNEKAFVHKKYTLDQNLERAKKWLEQLKVDGNKDNDNKYNRVVKLPRNISYYIDKHTKEKLGYNINVMKNGKSHVKCICKKNLTMDEKLKIAIQMRDELKESLCKNEEVSSQK